MIASAAPTADGGRALVGVLAAGLWAGLAWGNDGTLPLLVSGIAAAGIALVLLLGRS